MYSMYIYIYIYIYTYMYMCIYIYMYIFPNTKMFNSIHLGQFFVEQCFSPFYYLGD